MTPGHQRIAHRKCGGGRRERGDGVTEAVVDRAERVGDKKVGKIQRSGQ